MAGSAVRSRVLNQVAGVPKGFRERVHREIQRDRSVTLQNQPPAAVMAFATWSCVVRGSVIAPGWPDASEKPATV